MQHKMAKKKVHWRIDKQQNYDGNSLELKESLGAVA